MSTKAIQSPATPIAAASRGCAGRSQGTAPVQLPGGLDPPFARHRPDLCIHGQALRRLSGLVANFSWSLYIPARLSLTCSLLWGRRVWPAIFAGELGMGLLTGQSMAASLIMAGDNAIEGGLAGWWFHDRLGRRLELNRVRDVVQLPAAELLVLQPLCAMIGIMALVVTSGRPRPVILSPCAAWYSANLYSMFIIAPTVLA